jgi:hypothetical protein
MGVVDDLGINVNKEASGWESAEQWKRELYALQKTFNELKKQFDELSCKCEEKDIVISALARMLQARGWQ